MSRKPRTPEQKAARAECDRARREANHEAILAREAEYRRNMSGDVKQRFTERRIAWRKANPEKDKEYQRRYREKVGHAPAKAWAARNPDRLRDIRLRADYGVTLDWFRETEAAQRGVCAICGRQETYRLPTGVQAPMVVDHDHATGKVRGLLCRACNSAIGHFQDDEGRLLSAVEYLRLHRG